MKKRLLCISMILLMLTLNACATNKKNTKEKRAMTKTSLLKGKTAFRFNISCENANIRIYMNGVQVFGRFDDPAIEMEYPTNDLILNGENELALLVESEGFTGKPKCTIDLVVREFNNFEMTPQKILTLSYDESQKHPTQGTTPMGSYSSYDGFKPSDKGDVHIAVPVLQKHKKSGTYGSDATFVRLKFELPTPFGRWKYASGEPILSKPYLDLNIKEAKDLQANDLKLAKLYEINHAIYKLAKAKDVDGLMEYFKERNLEFDKALYRKPGTTEASFKKRLEEVLNDPNMKLWEISEERWKKHQIVFRVDDNNKLAWLTDLILLNYTKGEGSSRYTMKFRWDGENWILTR